MLVLVALQSIPQGTHPSRPGLRSRSDSPPSQPGLTRSFADQSDSSGLRLAGRGNRGWWPRVRVSDPRTCLRAYTHRQIARDRVFQRAVMRAKLAVPWPDPVDPHRLTICEESDWNKRVETHTPKAVF